MVALAPPVTNDALDRTRFRQVRQLWTPNRKTGELDFHFHEGQARAWLSTRRFIFMLAGTQGGKTSFGPAWLQREMVMCGPGDYLAVTSTFPLLKLKMLPEFLRLFRGALGWGTWHAGDKVFELHADVARELWGEAADDMPTRVIFGSANNADSLESATAKAAWLDEVGQDRFRLSSWEAIERRLHLHQGRVLAGTTLYNLGWLKAEIFDRWRSGDPDYAVIQFSSAINPAFPRAEYERARRTLPRWKFRMMYRGEYDRPENLIYGCFEDDYRENGGHLVCPFDIPPEWPRHGGIDPGGTNTAKLWVAEDPRARIFYVYRESLSGGKTTADHAREVLDSLSGVNRGRWWLGAKAEAQIRRDYFAAGLRTLPPLFADVEAGIARAWALLSERKVYVFDTCRGLRDELGTYARKLDDNGQPTEVIADKETFHRLDAFRYVAQGLYRGAGDDWVAA